MKVSKIFVPSQFFFHHECENMQSEQANSIITLYLRLKFTTLRKMIFLITTALGMLVLGMNAGLNFMQILWMKQIGKASDLKAPFVEFLAILSNTRALRLMATLGFLFPYAGGFVIYGRNDMLTYLIFAAATLYFFSSVYMQGKKIIPMYRKVEAMHETLTEDDLRGLLRSLVRTTYVRMLGAILAFAIMAYLFFFFLEKGMPL